MLTCVFELLLNLLEKLLSCYFTASALLHELVTIKHPDLAAAPNNVLSDDQSHNGAITNHLPERPMRARLSDSEEQLCVCVCV